MKFIFVILYGADDVVCKVEAPIYQQLHDLSILYYEKMRLTYDMNYFYVQYRPEQEEELVESNHHIYLKGKEEFSKIYEKTVRAIQYIHTAYPCDYIVRTNISSFWNIPTLFTLSLPPTRCISGILMFNWFISGTGIIMSSDMGDLLVKEEPHHCPDCDDVFISRKLVHYAPMHLLSASMMYYLTDDPQNVHNVIPENKNDILYFRIKNGQNRQRDVELFKILLRDMYDIHA
jgi:hypothetical protein